jgi:hypothetical protein
MVFNATFSYIGSALFAEETRVPGENHRPTLFHNVVHPVEKEEPIRLIT